MDQGDDPYRLLGVSKDASEADIKKAYRKLALEHHPDRQSDENARVKAQHKFAQIAGAYELLMDEGSRKEYDQSQKEQAKSTGTARGFDQQNTHIQFNDPYEVFKRNFKDEFGFEYPGAKYDFAEVPAHMRAKQAANNQKLLTNGEHVDEPSTSNNGRNAGKRNNNNNSKSDDSRKKTGALTIFRGNKDRQLANTNQESQLSNSAPRQEPNNRPTSMETTTKKIQHDDGTVETVTEIKITRPDGSTETCRTTDKGDKRPGWNGKNKDKPKMLTNGNKPKGLLTGGKKTPLLTNGKNTPKMNNSNAKQPSAKDGQMVPYKPPEQAKKRGLFGFGKAKQ